MTTAGASVPRLFDSHCHAGDGDITVCGSVQCAMCVMGTHEDDWALVSAAVAASCDAGGAAVPCFGVHPWRAHQVQDGWLERLRSRLESTPGCIMGEIGLDKACRTQETGKCEYGKQLEVFEAQLALAHELGLPVSVHCVRAVGKVFGLLERLARDGKLPPAIAMHSFGCDRAWIPRFLGLPGAAVYFGFSECINHRVPGSQEEKLKANILAVPRDRLLLESDIDDPRFIDEHMQRFSILVASFRGDAVAELAASTTANALAFVNAGSGGEPREAAEEGKEDKDQGGSVTKGPGSAGSRSRRVLPRLELPVMSSMSVSSPTARSLSGERWVKLKPAGKGKESKG